MVQLDNAMDKVQEQNEPKITLWDNSVRSKNLIIVFWILIGSTLLGLIPGYNEINILESLGNGEYVDDVTIESSDNIQGFVGISQTILYIISVVLFLNWFRRAYANLNRLSIKTHYEENMVGWYFVIPILSLYRPYKTMVEIWEKTQTKAKTLNSNFSINNNTYTIGIWWTLFIISNFIGRFIMKSAFKQDTIEQIIQGSQAILISDIMQIPEALLVIYIVSSIAKMETAIAEGLKRNGGIVLLK
jgi:hypothetical protein